MSENSFPNPSRQAGYIIAILVNVGLIYVFNNILTWNAPYLTQDFSRCLPALTMSLAVTIFCNAVFMVYDPKYFRHLMQVVMNCFGWYSLLVFYQVLPLDLPVGIPQIVRAGLLVALIIIPIATIVEAVQALHKMSKLTS